MTLKDIQTMAAQAKAQFIDIKFSDLLGRWRHIMLPAESLAKKLFDHGVGVDGSSITGFAKIKSGDMIVLPDKSTAFIDPFYEHPTVSMIGDVVQVDGVIMPFDRNPRTVAQKAEAYLHETGVANGSFWGPEFEFYIFNRVAFQQGSSEAFYFVDSEEAEWNSGEDAPDNQGYQIRYKGGYHAAPPSDRTSNLRNEMCAVLGSLGIPVKYHHHEVGGVSQAEIELGFGPLVRMADWSMLVKYVIKSIAVRHGASATFMPKPMYNEPGSGWHVHQFLASDGKSVFYDGSKPHKLSEIGWYYVGGLIRHAGALLCFTNPSTNSYKRLVPGFEAPVRGTYSMGNRSAAIRIPGYQLDSSTYRVEFRPPDATCNPYLALSAMLMAGIDGIRNKIDPGEECKDDLSALPPSKLAKIPVLPTSLQHAILALKNDRQFLLEGNVFTQELIDHWISLKEEEANAIRVRPHPYEFSLYYNC